MYTLTGRRAVRAAATATLAAVLPLALAPSHASAALHSSTPRSAHCVVIDRVDQELAAMHADTSSWTATLLVGALSVTYATGPHTGRVEVSTTTPCSLIPSVVHHEWMHLQQLRFDGRDAMIRDGLRTELVADCGSMLQGSTYTPYIDQARRTGVVGCGTGELADARRLLAAGQAA